MLCNYSFVGCDVAYVRSFRKTDDDAACHFREKNEFLVFYFDHITLEMNP